MKVEDYIKFCEEIIATMEIFEKQLKEFNKMREKIPKEEFDRIKEIMTEEEVEAMESKYNKLWSSIRKKL